MRAAPSCHPPHSALGITVTKHWARTLDSSAGTEEGHELGHAEHVSIVAAPLEFAFDYATDYRNAPDWMFGLTRLVPMGDKVRERGAVFDTDVRIGSTPLLVEAIEWVANSAVTMKSIRGIEGQVRWTFRALPGNRTEIKTTVDYRVGFGIAGRALGALIKAMTATAIRHSDKHVRTNVETLYRQAQVA